MSNFALRFITVVIAAFSLTAFGNNGGNMVGAASQAATSKWKVGIQYQKSSNGPCNKNANTVCLSSEEYKQACDAATGINQEGIKAMAILADKETQKVVAGGNITKTSVRWNQPRNACIALAEAKGVVNGNTINRSIVGIANGFVSNGKGGLFVSRID